MADVTAVEKAAFLLADKRVQIRWATEGVVDAMVLGATALYQVTWTSHQGWSCECAEVRGRCSHIEAVRQVTMRPPIAAGRS